MMRLPKKGLNVTSVVDDKGMKPKKPLKPKEPAVPVMRKPETLVKPKKPVKPVKPVVFGGMAKGGMAKKRGK